MTAYLRAGSITIMQSDDGKVDFDSNRPFNRIDWDEFKTQALPIIRRLSRGHGTTFDKLRIGESFILLCCGQDSSRVFKKQTKDKFVLASSFNKPRAKKFSPYYTNGKYVDVLRIK